jgi:myo-inositol 2-dehydrogenase/D-chiro-inositol 1-dehydrogenase
MIAFISISNQPLSSPWNSLVADPTQQRPHDTRRDFLKSSAIILGGAGLAAAANPAAYAAGDDTITVALIGCGARGAGAAVQALSTVGPVKLWAMADAFQDRLEICLRNLQRGLTASYDRDASTGMGERANVPKERQFAGLDAYRKAIDSGVDVVLLIEPPGFRPKHFEYAVQAGKHVFMEKPVATDAHGVRRVLAAAEEAKRRGLKVGVGLQRHHQPSYEEAIPRIHDGEIGPVRLLCCYWNGGPPAKTPVLRAGNTELEHQVRNWYFFSWLSGDHICEQHVHNLDVCNWIMQSHPIEAQGMGGRQVRVGSEHGDIFDHHAVEFTYADGTRMYSQCRQIRGCAARVMEVAHGERGVAALGNRVSIKVDGKPLVRLGRQGAGANPYQNEHDVLFDAIRNNKPHNEAEYGATSTMTAIMGRLATYSGKVIKWDEAIRSDMRLTTDAEAWDAEPPVLPNEDGEYAVAVPGVTKVV